MWSNIHELTRHEPDTRTQIATPRWEWKEPTREVKYVLQKLGKGYVTIRLEAD